MCRNIESQNLEEEQEASHIVIYTKDYIIGMFVIGLVMLLLTVLPAILPPLPPPPMIVMGIPVVLMLMLLYLAISYPPLLFSSSNFDNSPSRHVM